MESPLLHCSFLLHPLVFEHSYGGVSAAAHTGAHCSSSASRLGVSDPHREARRIQYPGDWQVNGTGDKQDPDPSGASVAQSEWLRVEERKIAFEPFKRPPSSSLSFPSPSSFLPLSPSVTFISFLTVSVFVLLSFVATGESWLGASRMWVKSGFFSF